MSKTQPVPVLQRLQDLGEELRTAEALVEGLRLRRDVLLLEAKEEQPSLSLQHLADTAGMRREAAHYAVLRARARRGEETPV
jgi:hypothetical protein